MAVVSGQVTFLNAGTVMVNFGIPVNDLDTFMGARTGTTELNGLDSNGHADANNQFCRFHKDGKAKKDTSNCIVGYDAYGNEVVKARVVSGWGTSILTFNVTSYNTAYGWDAIARS